MKTTDFVKVNTTYGIVREQRMQGDFKIEQPDGSFIYAFPEQCEVITENEYLRGTGKGERPVLNPGIFAIGMKVNYVSSPNGTIHKGFRIVQIHPSDKRVVISNGKLTVTIPDWQVYPAYFDNVSDKSSPRIQSFTDAAKPLMQWLRENEHPHVKAIVTGDRADILEEKLGILNNR